LLIWLDYNQFCIQQATSGEISNKAPWLAFPWFRRAFNPDPRGHVYVSIRDIQRIFNGDQSIDTAEIDSVVFSGDT